MLYNAGRPVSNPAWLPAGLEAPGPPLASSPEAAGPAAGQTGGRERSRPAPGAAPGMDEASGLPESIYNC